MHYNLCYKVRIYPNKYQFTMLNRYFGSTRFVWNKILSDLRKHKTETNIDKYIEKYPFLSKIHRLALKSTELRVKREYERNLDSTKFKIDDHTGMFEISNVFRTVHVTRDRLKITNIGCFVIKNTFEIPDDNKIKYVVIKKNKAGEYHACIHYEFDKEPEPSVKTNKSIGLDFSLKSFYVDSNGDKPNITDLLEKEIDKLKKLQTIWNGKQPGSKNKEKARKKWCKQFQHIYNIKRNFLHKCANDLLEKYDVISVESLDLRDMGKKRIGPDGKSYHMGSKVYEIGYYKFITLLQYKSKLKGKTIIKVNRLFPSSQLCYNCNHINKKTKDLNLRTIVCDYCGSIYDRDINAAKNINREGMRIYRSMIENDEQRENDEKQDT